MVLVVKLLPLGRVETCGMSTYVRTWVHPTLQQEQNNPLQARVRVSVCVCVSFFTCLSVAGTRVCCFSLDVSSRACTGEFFKCRLQLWHISSYVSMPATDTRGFYFERIISCPARVFLANKCWCCYTAAYLVLHRPVLYEKHFVFRKRAEKNIFK